MTDKSISVGGNFEGNLIQDSTVEGNVSAAINKLPASANPAKPGIKELLEQLTTTINAESSLDKKSQEKALKQVEALAKAAQNSNEGNKQELADGAITMLKGIFSGLQSGATLLVEWNKLLPALSQMFGIG